MEKNNYKGKYIVFEGLDGSGQSTQAALLVDFLNQQGINAFLTKEPTDMEIGKLIRRILKKEISVSPEALQRLFTADRADHLDAVIKPALSEGKWVISDRYFFSTFAYGFMNTPMDWLIRINQFLMPDLTFLLKVQPKICLKRIDARGERQFFEEKEKLEKIWLGYEEVLKKFPEINLINGEQSVEKVFADIKKIVEKFITEVK